VQSLAALHEAPNAPGVVTVPYSIDGISGAFNCMHSSEITVYSNDATVAVALSLNLQTSLVTHLVTGNGFFS
jgi:uncharacterized membrane protein